MSGLSIVPFSPKVPKVLHKLHTSTVIAIQPLLGQPGNWVAAQDRLYRFRGKCPR